MHLAGKGWFSAERIQDLESPRVTSEEARGVTVASPTEAFKRVIMATANPKGEGPLPALEEPFAGLHHGQRGPRVERLQRILQRWNPRLKVGRTGVYDQATRRAVTLYRAIYSSGGSGGSVDDASAVHLRKMEDGSFWDSPPTKTKAQEMLYNAAQKLGVPYVLGGDGKQSIDCGSLTAGAMGGATSRLADMQYLAARKGEGLSFHRDRPEPGDLIFYRIPTRQSHIAYDGVTHVTMYVGDGLMLAASSSAGKVILQPTAQLQRYTAGFGRPQG